LGKPVDFFEPPGKASMIVTTDNVTGNYLFNNATSTLGAKGLGFG